MRQSASQRTHDLLLEFARFIQRQVYRRQDNILQHFRIRFFQYGRVDLHRLAFLVAGHGNLDCATACSRGDGFLCKLLLCLSHLLLQALKLLHHAGLTSTPCGTIKSFCHNYSWISTISPPFFKAAATIPSALTFAGGACLALETTHFMDNFPPHTFATALRVISICSGVSILDRTSSFANPI